MGQAPAQQVGQLSSRLKALGGILRVQPGDEGGQPGGDLGVDLADRPGLIV